MKEILGNVAKVFGSIALLLVLVIGGYFLLSPKPPKAPDNVGNIVEAEAYLEDLVEYGTPPGISLAVVKDGAVVYHRGFGLADGPKDILATQDTVYKWMSTTKIITAIAIMQLHEQNLLNIDDPVAGY
jgi:CubicO group peptidase (beta-lactamase class C family)